MALYVHRRFNCAIRAVQCKVVEQVFECFKLEPIRVPNKVVYVTRGDGID